MKHLKQFKDSINQPLKLILIVISSAFIIYNNIFTGNFWRVMTSLMPVILLVVATILLQYKEKTFAAHGVLFVGGYLNGVRIFFSNLLSYNFFTKKMVSFGTVIESFFYMAISLYLLAMVLSYVIDQDYKVQFKKSPVWISILIASIYFYIGFGFNTTFLKIVPPILALMFGYEFISVILLLAGVVHIPFDIIDDLYSKIIKFNSLNNFVFWAIGLYLLVMAVLVIIKMLKNPFQENLMQISEDVEQSHINDEEEIEIDSQTDSIDDKEVEDIDVKEVKDEDDKEDSEIEEV